MSDKNYPLSWKFRSENATERICDICSETFEGKGNAKYCSKICAKEADGIKAKVRMNKWLKKRKIELGIPDAKSEKTCLDCVIKFQGAPHSKRCPLCQGRYNNKMKYKRLKERMRLKKLGEVPHE